MKKILILTNTDLTVIKFRSELVAELIAQGYKVYISATSTNWKEDLIDLGCVFIETNIQRRKINVLEDIKLLLKYISIFKKIKPDLFITYTIKPNIYANIINIFFQNPCIANVTGLGTAIENPGILQKFTLFLYKLAFRNVNCVFFQNNENLCLFQEKGIIKNSYRLVPGSGVNLDHFQIRQYSNKNSFNFVYVGRVMKDKGIEEYISAAQILKREYNNIQFHICGFCEDHYQQIIDKYAREKLIIYHGLLKEVDEIYELADCIVHPSYHEGLSNTLLEAAASGRPIIATNISGCKEVVSDGVNGFLFSPRKVNELVNAIRKFINLSFEERVSMGIAGRQKAEAEFDRKKVVQTYIKEINNLLEA